MGRTIDARNRPAGALPACEAVVTTSPHAMRAALDDLLGPRPQLEPGHVWLAGGGPGDPGHLTLHALAGLVQADAIVHDALIDPRTLAMAGPEAECIFAGKRGGKPSTDQADITGQLIELARAGRRVLRLKGGDPYVFGRGAEEAFALAEAGIPFRVLPGVTAGVAGLAAASIPATMRDVNQAIVFATGHPAGLEHRLDWRALARLGQPIVLYMGLTRLDGIVAALQDGGMAPDMPAAGIAAATLPGQRVVVSPLAHLPEALRAAELPTPVLIVIGEIVRVRERLLALVAGAV